MSKTKSERNINAMTPLKSFRVLLDNWNDITLEKNKEAKALFLKEDEIVGIFDIPFDDTISLDKEISKIDPLPIFMQAAKVNANEIVIAQNAAFNNLKNNTQTDEIVKTFKSSEKDFGICLVDYLILSSNGYYSYKNNNLI